MDNDFSMSIGEGPSKPILRVIKGAELSFTFNVWFDDGSVLTRRVVLLGPLPTDYEITRIAVLLDNSTEEGGQIK